MKLVKIIDDVKDINMAQLNYWIDKITPHDDIFADYLSEFIDEETDFQFMEVEWMDNRIWVVSAWPGDVYTFVIFLNNKAICMWDDQNPEYALFVDEDEIIIELFNSIGSLEKIINI